MSGDSGAERRARKAERRADNIRKAHPGDQAAEKRAQKAERRAENIRNYARDREEQRSSWSIPGGEMRSSSDSSVGDDDNSWMESIPWEWGDEFLGGDIIISDESVSWDDELPDVEEMAVKESSPRAVQKEVKLPPRQESRNVKMVQYQPWAKVPASSTNEPEGSLLGGCIVLLVALAGIYWVINTVVDWLRGVF